jgi:hypothetical protein
MSSFDEAGVAVISEDVSVTRESGEADDAALRALRDEQATLDVAWKKRKLLLEKYPFLVRLTTSKNEVEPRISPAEPRAVTKRWYVCKGCNKDAGGVNSSRWLEHLLHCEQLAQAARDESAVGGGEIKNALLQLCRTSFKVDASRTRVNELRAFFSPGLRSNTSEHGTTATTTTVVESNAQTDMRRYVRPPLSTTEINAINDAVSELIIESSIPFAWTSSPAFFKFMHALRPDLFNDTEKARIKNGAGLISQPKNVRGRQWHSTRGLERLHEKRMQAALKELEESEELAMAVDGWQTEDGRKVLNLAITLRESGREYYWKSVELGTESESAEFMQRTTTQVMKGLPLKKFKCIVGDNTGHVIKFLEAIASTPETSHVTPIGCYAHRFNLLAGDVVEAFKDFFADLERAINKLRVKTQMRALFDAARKEKNVTKNLETYCQTRWASAHVCLHSYVANIDVLRFLNEDQGKIAKDFRKLRTPDLELTFDVLFNSESQMAVRQLEPLFRGLAAANKFVEATRAHLAEVFPLCWALEKDLSQWLANVKTSAHQSWIARATRKATVDGPTCTTPEELSVVLKRVYDVRFKGLEAQPGKASTKRQPLRDDPLVHLASCLSYMLHKKMRIKRNVPVADTFMSKEGLQIIQFREEDEDVPDVQAADLAVENLNAMVIPETAKKFQNHYSDLFTNEAYVEACTDRTFVDVTLEQLEYIRRHNWRRNFLEQEDVVNWPAWKHLIPYARRMNAIVPHSASVERMNSAQKLVHNGKRLSLSHAHVEKLTFVYFNDTHKRRAVGSFEELVSEVSKVTENEVVASPVGDADGDARDDGVGADEILSSDDDGLDEYLKDADELVMSPLANVSNRTEMTCVGNLVENMQVQDDLRPARDIAKETFAQKAARKALERQEKQKRRKHRRLNQ